MQRVTPGQLIQRHRWFLAATHKKVERLRRIQRLAKEIKQDVQCYCQRCAPGQLKLM